MVLNKGQLVCECQQKDIFLRRKEFGQVYGASLTKPFFILTLLEAKAWGLLVHFALPLAEAEV